MTKFTTIETTCENTTSKIAITNFEIPANTWRDGEKIEIEMIIESKQNSGSSANGILTADINGYNILAPSSTMMSNAVNTGKSLKRFYLIRIDADVLVVNYPVNGENQNAALPFQLNNFTTNYFGTNANLKSTMNIISGIDFSQNNTVNICAEFSVANQNTCIKVNYVNVIKYDL